MLSRIKHSVALRVSGRKVRSLIVAVVLTAAVLQSASSQAFSEETQKLTDQDAIQQLIQANHELLQQIRDLQTRVIRLESKTNEPALTASVDAHALGPSASAAPHLSSATGLAPSPAIQNNEPSAPANAVKLRLFGDLGYRVSDQKGETNSFQIGSLDLFMTGSLSDRISILGELLFIPQKDNSFELDVERLLLQYKANDYVSLAVGRFHSSIGYYNTAFHQGAWFQTAVDRPFMYAFDDGGGFLPLQEVGVIINGQIPSGKLGLNYTAEMGNGRSHLLNVEPAQNTQDTNNGKSFNLALFARPSWIPGLQAGFSIYHDHLTFADNINHSELISTVHVVYLNSNYEFLNEGMLVRHTGSTLGFPGIFHTPAFYTQISRKFGMYRPYFRYAYLNAGLAEPIYGDPADGPVVGGRHGPTFGLRYDFNDHAAMKLQYDHSSRRGQQSINALQAQVSFAF